MKKEILNKIIDDLHADGILLYSPQNRYWFSRFDSSLGYILYTKQKSYLFVDGRYITAAKNSSLLTNIDEIISFGSVFDLINEKLGHHKIKKLLFEADWVFVNQAQILKNKLNTEMIAYNFDSIRMIKDEWEIKQIKKACDITHQVFLEVLDFIKPGMNEIQIAHFVNNSFLKNGAERLSFNTIVASGVNGSMPHAVPSSKIINKGEFITLDMGCYYNGYASDQTRTFALGDNNNEQLKEIYEIVYQAQQKGIEAIKPGITGKMIHKICFDYIDSKGYGKYFTHGTGHGLGIEIHEEPYNSVNGDKILEPGMCVTVEPGIYIPNLGGVRIEDDILVTKNGHEFLTNPLRNLQVVK